MRLIKTAYSGTKYHKKSALFFCVLFSLLLLLLMTVMQLIHIQQINSRIVREQWALFKDKGPAFISQIYATVQSSSSVLVTSYRIVLIGCLILSALSFFLFSYLTARRRKSDIQSLRYMNVPKYGIVISFLMELFISVMTSFILVAVVLFLFKADIVRSIYHLDQHLLEKQVAVELVNHPDLTDRQTSDTPDNDDAKKDRRLIIPFSDTALAINYGYDMPLFQLFQIFLRSFLILVGLFLIVSSLGFYSVISKCYQVFYY